jgi:hypothetical protein
MRLYKLTDRSGRTRPGCTNETQWGEGVTHTATGAGGLCTNGVIHAYRDPLLAILLNPVNGNYADFLLWEADGFDVVEEHADKIGVRSLTTLRRIPAPKVTTEHRVRFAIGCALRIYDGPQFITWASDWLANTNRAARSARAAATWAAEAAVWWRARGSVMAARAAAEAALSAAAARGSAEARLIWQDLTTIAHWSMTEKPFPKKWLAKGNK